MERDFCKDAYLRLLDSLIQLPYRFLPFREFFNSEKKFTICLRHDVDMLPFNSLEFAKIQQALNIRGTYFFRTVKKSWNENVIKEIHERGHEIGYHYENLALHRGNVNLAIEDFETGLSRLREFVPVSTICMHGSPFSKFDSKELWKYYDYKDYDIIAEPYFDVNFSEVLYLTDTGRRWDGNRVSVRDKVINSKKKETAVSVEKTNSLDWASGNRVNSAMNMSHEALDFQSHFTFKSTFDIIHAAKNSNLPEKIMLTFHPQRWTNNSRRWIREKYWQKTKNIVKYFLIKTK